MIVSIRRGRIVALAIALVAVMLAPAASAVAATASSDPLVVQTDAGAVQGKTGHGVDSFLGIPYAAPPVGALRWEPPQAHAPWSGVRPATTYGARCTALASTNGVRSDVEDCLFVNVQRPAGASAGRKLPVYVFIHGGGLVNGSSNQAGGTKIVRITGAIVVSMNYRLGVLGFLGLPGMSSGTGNFGFLDQQFALAWVQRNITAFGGDPARVTLGGESAGAFSVCGHLTAPGSQGLFARAMMESGSCFSRTLAQTQSDSETFAAAAGCPDAAQALACLRGKSTAKLLDASTAFSPTLTSGTAALPQPTAAAVAAGDFARVPIVTGSNRDEGRTFSQGYIGFSEAQYDAWLQSTFGSDAPAILAHYPWPSDADQFTAAYLIGAIFTDSGLLAGIGGCSQLHTDQAFARYVPTYSYEFDAREGPGLTPIPGYVWGAGHAAELAYLFPSFDNGTPIAPTFNAGERQLSRDMIDYWGGFVFRASPNAPGLANWPRFDRTGKIMSLRVAGQSTPITTAEFRAEHQCDFWGGAG